MYADAFLGSTDDAEHGAVFLNFNERRQELMREALHVEEGASLADALAADLSVADAWEPSTYTSFVTVMRSMASTPEGKEGERVAEEQLRARADEGRRWAKLNVPKPSLVHAGAFGAWLDDVLTSGASAVVDARAEDEAAAVVAAAVGEGSGDEGVEEAKGERKEGEADVDGGEVKRSDVEEEGSGFMAPGRDYAVLRAASEAERRKRVEEDAADGGVDHASARIAPDSDKLRILWDIENVTVPPTIAGAHDTAAALEAELKARFFPWQPAHSVPCRTYAFYNADGSGTTLTDHQRKGLTRARVLLIDTGMPDSERADNMIEHFLTDMADDLDAEHTVIALVSADTDFTDILTKLTRSGFQFVLVTARLHRPSTKQLAYYASRVVDWDAVTARAAKATSAAAADESRGRTRPSTAGTPKLASIVAVCAERYDERLWARLTAEHGPLSSVELLSDAPVPLIRLTFRLLVDCDAESAVEQGEQVAAILRAGHAATEVTWLLFTLAGGSAKNLRAAASRWVGQWTLPLASFRSKECCLLFALGSADWLLPQLDEGPTERHLTASVEFVQQSSFELRPMLARWNLPKQMLLVVQLDVVVVEKIGVAQHELQSKLPSFLPEACTVMHVCQLPDADSTTFRLSARMLQAALRDIMSSPRRRLATGEELLLQAHITAGSMASFGSWPALSEAERSSLRLGMLPL
eukprot:PLAT3593.2.p1 GENE.PLAT3593.2~~PLAT3593.2.p1  ORF type:complete len:717 (+),score=249.95 PLAT3593.2:63-2153(+)